jgi:hypothetical protein
MQVMKKQRPTRSIGLAFCVTLALAALLFVRDATARLSDTEVRHGVHTGALVLAVDADRATVRIPRPDDDVVTTITRHGDYTAGDTIGVVYDVVDPARASEQGAPAPSTLAGRALVVAVPLLLAAAAAWLSLRRPDEPMADEVNRRDVVRGGREVQPQLAR